MRPKIEELGRGGQRLLWLGGIRRPDHNATALEVEVVFVEDPLPPGRRPYWRSIYRPIEELPLFGVQSYWHDGRCRGYDEREHPLETLHVKPEPLRYAFPNSPDKPPFSSVDYPLYDKRVTAGCAIFATEEGVELVVPGWQILQAWYLFDRDIVSAVLAGHLNVDADYGTTVPWRPGTRCVDGHVEYHLPRGLPVDTAKAFSRLLFDPVAQRQANLIWNRLMSEGRSHLPIVRPPHAGPARWTFRMRPLVSVDGQRRWLLLHLHCAQVPLPFASFTSVEYSARPGAPLDEPPIVMRHGADVPKGDADIPLVGNRSGGRGARLGRFTALYFLDPAVDALSVETRVEPLEPTATVTTTLVLPDPNEPAEAASMTTEGPKDPRVIAVQPAAPPKPAEDPHTLFERSRTAFEELVAFVDANELEGTTWSARIVVDNAPDCFLRRSPTQRSFVILELQVGKTYTYALDALRQADDVEFPLTMVRRVGAAPLDPAHFHVWLRNFPFDGSAPWGNAAQVPNWLYKPVGIRHQTTELPANIKALAPDEQAVLAEAHRVRLFRNRLIRHLTQFERRANSGRIERRQRTRTVREST